MPIEVDPAAGFIFTPPVLVGAVLTNCYLDHDPVHAQNLGRGHTDI